MNRDQWSGDEHALFNALRQLVEDRFVDLSHQALEEVFEAVLEECASEGGEEQFTPREDGSSGWTGRISSGVVRALDPHSVSMDGERSDQGVTRVQLVVESPAKMSDLLDQILEVGAVVVRLDPQPELNELVELVLEFPGVHLTVEPSGRVVHNAEDITAIEVSGLSREDRVALVAMREDIDSQLAVDDEPAKTDRPAQVGPPSPETAAEPMAEDSVQQPGAVPVVHEDDDPRRSFAPLGSTHRGSRRGTTGRHGRQRRMVQTTRRRVDLPDPDMNVATSTLDTDRRDGKTTREFYGPPPVWHQPQGDAERVETLSGERVLDILLQLSEDGFTGMLMLTVDGEDSEQLLFDGGYLVERSIRPRVTDEELGPMLLAADRITQRQLAMAAAHADEVGLGVERSLMDLGILNPEQLRHAIAGRLAFLLREFCDCSRGAVQIFHAHALPAGFLPQPPLRVHVAVERIIYKRLFRRLSQRSAQRREQRMQQYLDTYPEPIEHQQDRLDRAVTDEQQQRFIDQTVTGNIRMREVMTESILSPPETFAVLFALHRMGLVRFDRSLHDTVVRERLRENITVKHMSVHKASYFEVLNVHWSSYSEVVEEAYENLSAQFDPERIPDDLEEEILEKVDEINERIEAAYAALAKRKTRHAYRTRIMPEYKLDHAIPLFLKQCELAERRNNFADARDAIRRVLEIDPGHEEARRKLKRLERMSGSAS